MGKPKQPSAPNYERVAEIQGEKNLEAIRTGANLNRVNQVNPYGSTTYKNLGGDQWSQTTSLSPDQQAILDAQERNQLDLGRIAGQRLGDVEGQGPLDLSGLPSRVTSVPGSQFTSNINAPSVSRTSVDLSRFGDLPTDFSAERRRAEDAIYGSATRYLDPQFAQEEETARTRLINAGNVEGSEAWKNTMADLGRRKEAAYSGAREQATIGGGSEASRMLADALRSRQQGVSEEFGTGQFENAATQQQFMNELQRSGLINQTQADQFAQQLTNAGLTNEARTGGLNELLTQRQLPLQEFMALYGGAPAPGMSSPAVPQAGTPQPGDYQGAAGQQYGAQIDQYNAQQARSAQNTNALAGLAQAAAYYYSDRRLKRDIERTGTLPNGIPTYRYRYLNDDAIREGVLADEVREVMPEAVIPDERGFDRVNYAAIGATHLLGVN